MLVCRLCWHAEIVMSSFGLLQKRCYAASTMMLILGTALEQTFKQTLTLPAISVGAPEIIIILVVVVLVFGTKRLPELGKGLGKSIKEFKSEMGQENSQENGPKSSSENSGQPLDSTEEGTGASTGNAQHTKSVNNAKVQQEHNA